MNRVVFVVSCALAGFLGTAFAQTSTATISFQA
jgi:hypothetical protein